MSKYVSGILVALVVLSVVLTGCGGGGGSSSNGGNPNPPPPDPTERTITGKIVSSATNNPGVANVAVTLNTINGPYTDVSGADGTFALPPMPVTTDIPSTFTVDAAGAGTGYRRDDLITYRSQEYLYNSVDTPVQLRNGDTNSLGTITIRYSPDDTPSIPFPSKDTIIAGRVVRSDDQTVGIAGVTVSFGTATTFTTTTGAKGYFALNVGRDVDVISLFLLSDCTFSIDTSTAGATTYPNTLMVTYQGQAGRAQNDLPVPDDVLNNSSNDLGNIVVQMSSGGGDGPPPPPM